MVEKLTVDRFHRHEGEIFRVRFLEGDAEPVELVLTEVDDMTSRHPHDAAKERQRAPFSLLFRGPHDRPLPSGIYRVSHDKFGEYELFLHPVQSSLHGQESNALSYEIAFS